MALLACSDSRSLPHMFGAARVCVTCACVVHGFFNNFFPWIERSERPGRRAQKSRFSMDIGKVPAVY